MMKGEQVLVSCCLLACLVSQLSAEPLQLDATTFYQEIGSEKVHFVKFYAPWCGHCKKLAPTWDELADKLGDSVIVAKVDCTVETKLCAEQGVRGYPTLKLFDGDKVVDYRDSRDIDSLVQFVLTSSTSENVSCDKVDHPVVEFAVPVNQKAPEVEVQIDDSGLVHLTDDNFDAYLLSNAGVHFVKFYAPWCGHCQRLAPTWDNLAAHFKSQQHIHISKVDCTLHSATCQHHGVKGYPTLLLFEGGSVQDKYTGSRGLQDLIEFVNNNAPSEPRQEGVVELTSDTFSQVIQKPGLTFVKFYAPWCGHCKRLAPTWSQLAEEAHQTSSVTVAKVDCTVEKSLCTEQDIHSYPTLVLFQSGKLKAEYHGSRDLESLRQFINEQSK